MGNPAQLLLPDNEIVLPFGLQRDRDRWYELTPHETQLRMVHDEVRFKVVPAGRRSGKTERAKRFLVKRSMAKPGTYFAAAPTNQQAKKIWWDDLKAMSFSRHHRKKPNESDRIIFFDNGSQLHVLGLDVAARIEGIPWDGGIIDEIANIKEDAWEANIKPALDTFNPTRPDYKAWCWLIGVPDGLNHYYDLYQYALTSGDPEWAAYHWKSSDILPADTIAAAKRSMGARQFRQEYEASFEGATGRIYEDFSEDNYTSATLQPHEEILWSHDQNFTPLSSTISVIRDKQLFILDEIVLTSAISRQSALEFVEKYKNHLNKHVRLFGDPAGRAGEKHGHASDYTDMTQVLKAHGWQVSNEVKRAAPAIKDRQNAVRALIRSYSGDIRLFINPNIAKWATKGLATVQVKEGSSFQEDQKNKYQHITTAIGYMVHTLYPIVGGGIAYKPINGLY